MANGILRDAMQRGPFKNAHLFLVLKILFILGLENII